MDKGLFNTILQCSESSGRLQNIWPELQICPQIYVLKVRKQVICFPVTIALKP